MERTLIPKFIFALMLLIVTTKGFGEDSNSSFLAEVRVNNITIDQTNKDAGLPSFYKIEFEQKSNIIPIYSQGELELGIQFRVQQEEDQFIAFQRIFYEKVKGKWKMVSNGQKLEETLNGSLILDSLEARTRVNKHEVVLDFTTKLVKK